LARKSIWKKEENMKYIKNKIDGTIYEWDEILAKK